MLFNSLHFAIYFPIVVALYFVLPLKVRWIWLLAASYYFYGSWKWEYLALLLVSTAVDYFAALGIVAAKSQQFRRWWLAMSMIANLGVLFFFKYYNFANESLRAVVEHFGGNWGLDDLNVVLPVGISFYTFQAMSYTIDVYRDPKNVERHYGIYSLYVVFFPQLVAGPIERSTHLTPQFRHDHKFDYTRAVEGLRLALWGMFKKIAIADRLAPIVNQVYNNPDDYYGPQLLLATYFFAFQIYCDFSGYSDIAIGTARVMGFDIMTNFRRPYHAASIVDFWRRWHISLSTWFRDYLYYPLGGNRVGNLLWYRNLLIVFIVSGAWHGARWTFIAWGAIHGVAMVLMAMSGGWRGRIASRLRELFPPFAWLQTPLGMLLTFHTVLLSWIFFRANSWRDLTVIFDHLRPEYWTGRSLTALADPFQLLVSISLIGLMELVHWAEAKYDRPLVLTPRPAWQHWAFSYLLILLMVLFGEFKNQEFIYFQF